MEANHVHHWHGKERLCGIRRFSLSAPTARNLQQQWLNIGLDAGCTINQ
jgi:hypothetical protein